LALDRTKFQRIGGVNPQLHLYNGTADTAATMQASGYFNALTDQIRNGDVILMVGNNNGSVDLAVVSSATGAATVTTVGVEGVTAT
jgi:uncharacterized phosphosugar-binding protein